MNLFLILIFFILVEPLKFGYFINKKTQANNQAKATLIIDYINDNLQKYTDNDMIQCEYDYGEENSENEIKNCIEKFKTENIIIIYAWCDRDIMEYSEELLKEYKMIIWCLNPYSYGKCSQFYIMGSSVVHYIDKCIIIIIYSYFLYF